MLDRVKKTFDLHPERPIADTAYGTRPMPGWLVDQRIAPHIPVVHCPAGDCEAICREGISPARTDGTWPHAGFGWDAESDR